jgi:hypothetical protein
MLIVVTTCGAASLGYSQSFYPDDIGNRWILESTDKIDVRTVTIKGPEILNGDELRIIEDETNGNVSQLFIRTEPDGVMLFRSVVSLPLLGAVTFDYSPPQVFLPTQIDLGSEWTVESEATIPLAGKIAVTNRAEVVAIEDVTVPVGTFRDCLKIVQDATIKLTIAELGLSSTMWLALEVGLVKSTNTDGVVFELIQLDIAQKEPETAVQPNGKLTTTWASIKRR